MDMAGTNSSPTMVQSLGGKQGCVAMSPDTALWTNSGAAQDASVYDMQVIPATRTPRVKDQGLQGQMNEHA